MAIYFFVMASHENRLTAREFDAAAPQPELDAGDAPPNNLKPNRVTFVTMWSIASAAPAAQGVKGNKLLSDTIILGMSAIGSSKTIST
ncbi:hypothetical protein U2H31_007099 [Pseudomonas aeruginosa]|nr:hypothetical protein [Pseudomonas aeruginosa]